MVILPPEPSPQPAHQTPDFTSVWSRFTKRQVVAAISAVAILLAVSGVLYFALGGGITPEAQVRQVINDFATAVDTEDQVKIVDLLCIEEAANITEDDDYDPTATGAESATRLDRQISDIHIMGQTASAQITFSTHESITIHLRQEQGTWHICATDAD